MIRNTPQAMIAKRRAATKAARRFVMRVSYMQGQRFLIPNTAVAQSSAATAIRPYAPHRKP